MKTNTVNDFKALEALRKASDNSLMASRVIIGYDLYTYLENVLKERIEDKLKEVCENES